jgi:hypothetical protein
MRLIIACLCLVFLVCLNNHADAANRFWIAAGASNWNNTANWSNASGGAGGFSVPTAADNATFNNLRVGNCTIDVPVNVLSITVTAGYTGTITQGTNTISTVNNASFSGGIFSGGSADITIGGNFTLNGTAFTSTSTLLEFDGNAAFTSGIFTHNNGNVKFIATGAASTISGTSPGFYNLEFVGSGFNYTISSAGNISVLNSLNISGVSTYNLNTGTIDVSGDINITNTANGCAGTATVNIIGAGNQNFNGASAAGQGALPKLTINKPSGTLNLANFPASSNAFTYTSGTVNAGTSTYCFTNGSNSPYIIIGSISLNNIYFLANANMTNTISAGTTLTALGDFTMAGTNRITLNTGNININGNIFLTNIAAAGGGTATITILGAGNETMDASSIAISQNLLPVIVINKPAGTLTLKGIISASRNWTYTSGIVDANSFSSTVAFGGNNLSIASNGMSFYNVTVTGNVATLTNNLTAINNITINAGRLSPVANTVNIAGNWSDYGTAGFTESTSTVNFNGSNLQTITSPGGENFASLSISNSGTGIQLNNDATIATSFTMTQGNINLNGNLLTLGISVANNGTLNYTSGTITGTGSFTRWLKSVIIPNGSSLGLFPMGTATDYRPFFLAAPVTKPTTGGTVTVTYNDATTNTSLPTYMDGAATIMVRKDLNWAVSTAGIAGGTYNLDVQGTGYGLIGTVSDLRLTLANTVVGTAGVNGGNTSNPQINRTLLTLANLTNSFYIGSVNSVNTPLPITLISFTAFPVNNEVKLSWTTAAELNNDLYTIERSTDGFTWDAVLQIAGAGTSSSLQTYSAYDPYPLSGKSYYRLKQTDIDGKQSYSPVVGIKRIDPSPEIFVFPNPASSQVTISFATIGHYEVSLVNINGQVLNNPVLTNSNSLSMDVSHLKAGLYFIRIKHDGITETKKIVVGYP